MLTARDITSASDNGSSDPISSYPNWVSSLYLPACGLS